MALVQTQQITGSGLGVVPRPLFYVEAPRSGGQTLGMPFPYTGQSSSWSYDNFGNRTSQSIGTTAGAQTTWAHYNVSNTNRMDATNQAPGGLQYDAAGDVINDGTNQYLYDAEGRICAVAGMPVAGLTMMTGYIYGADGIRVAKGAISSWSCDPSTNGFQTSTERDSILGPGPATEQIAEVDMTPAGMAWDHANVFAAGKLVATYNTSGTFTDGSFTTVGLHFYLDDPIGTRRAQTDYNGVLEMVCFGLPYGDGLSCSGSTPDPTAHHFTGKERDQESGNDY